MKNYINIVLLYLILFCSNLYSAELDSFYVARSVEPKEINIKGGGNDTAEIKLTIFAPTKLTTIYHPQDVILLFDVSGSMNNTKLSGAKTAGKAFVDSLNLESNISLWKFSDKSKISMISPFTKDRALLKTKIDALVAGGGTYMNSALMQVLDYSKTASNKPPIIVVLTDGAATDGRLNDDGTGQIIGTTTESQNAFDSAKVVYKKDKTKIFTIAFGTSGLDTNTLKYYADSTGGKFFYSPTNEVLGEVFSEIAYTINSTVAIQIDERIPMINDILPPWFEYVPNSQRVSISGGVSEEVKGFDISYINTTVGISQKLTWNLPSINASNVINISYKVQATSSGELSTEVTTEKFNETSNFGKIIYRGALENEFYQIPFPDATVTVKAGFSKFGFILVPREAYVGDSIGVRLVALDNQNSVISTYSPQNPIVLKADKKQLFTLNGKQVDSIIVPPSDFNIGYSSQYYLKNSGSELLAHLFAVDSANNQLLGSDSAKWSNNPLVFDPTNYKLYILKKSDFDSTLPILALKSLAINQGDTLSLYLEDSLDLIAVGIDDSLGKVSILNVDWSVVGFLNNSSYDFSKFNKTGEDFSMSLDINSVKSVGVALLTNTLLNQYGVQNHKMFIKILDPVSSFQIYFPELGMAIDSSINDTVFNVQFASSYNQIYKPFFINSNSDTVYLSTYWNVPNYTDGVILADKFQIFYENADTVEFNIERNGYKVSFKMVLKSTSEAGVYPNPIPIFSVNSSNGSSSSSTSTISPSFYVNISGDVKTIELSLYDIHGNFVKKYSKSDFIKNKKPSALYYTYICNKWDGKNYNNNFVNSGNYFAVIDLITQDYVDKDGVKHSGDERRYLIKFYMIGGK